MTMDFSTTTSGCPTTRSAIAPYRTALFSLLIGSLVLLTGGILTGCDQGGVNDDGDNIITPSTSRVAFEVTPGTADTTQQLTLTYTDLDARPQPTDVPAPFTIEVVEETGEPSDGSSVFDVTFSPPEEIASFTEKVVFEASDQYVTIQLVGSVGFDDELVTDYAGMGVVNDIIGFNGIGASNVEGQLSLSGSETGGPGQFPGAAHILDEVVDFGQTPVLVARMKVSADSETPAIVRAALNQAGDLPDANTSADPLIKEIPADGEYRNYYFDFRDLFVQFDGQPVDPTNIGEIVFLVNDGGSLEFLGRSDTFTGTILVDRLARRPDIPGEDDGGGGDENEAPSASFSFTPSEPTIDETVTFTDESTDDGMITARDWDFGDGTTATGEMPTHTYTSAGDYTVSLTVTDDEGATATATQTVTVTDGSGTDGFRGDDDGDGRIVFDDFEDGLQEDEYFTFQGGGAGIGLAESSDVPAESDGTLALEASIDGGAGGGFAGFGKEIDGIDVSDLGSDPYFTMYVKSNATSTYTLEINLQEDQDGNGTFDGSGAVDDEFQYEYLVEPSASGYTRISVPLSAFADDNAVNNGGDGQLSNRIANLVFAIGNLPAETFTLTIDDIIYSDEDLSPDNGGGGGDPEPFRGDDDGDGQIIFDDFEDDLQDDEYFTFQGGGAGIGLAESDDVPMESSGSTALAATIEGGTGGGFAGFGKGVGSEIEVEGIDVADLGSDPYFTMYIQSDNTSPYTLEINLQEDQDGNGTFDGSGAVDDEFQYEYLVEPSASGYTRISVPLSAFADDNAVNNGGDGQLSNRIANLVFAIGNLPAETFTLTIDDIIYSDEDLGSDDGGEVQSACGEGYELFFEDNFDGPNDDFWDRGSATFQGNLATFRADNISYEDGKMLLTLKKEQLNGKPYTGAELRTDNQEGFYSYGCYEVRMKSAGPSGTVSSFFAFRYNPWQEIDIEIVGKNNRSMLTNIYFNEGPEGASNNDPFQVPPFPEGVGLSYDASEEFHNYAFEWTPGEIKWYRDGQLVKQATVEGADPNQIPDLQMQIMMNLWVSSAPSFAGEVDDSNFPVQSEYDWVRFYRPVN